MWKIKKVPGQGISISVREIHLGKMNNAMDLKKD